LSTLRLAVGACTVLLAVTSCGRAADTEGFRLTRAASRKLSEPERIEPTPQGKSYVGAAQVFAEWDNGYSATATHAQSPLRDVAPLRPADAHATLVRDYFASAGLGAERVARTSVTAGSGGSATVLHREVDGVPVPDSFAWARFSADGVVLAEQVWWPPLPSDLPTKIDDFRALLERGYRAKLPAPYAQAEGQLTVHHGLPLGAAYAVVTWDVSAGGSTRLFDVSGSEFRRPLPGQ
jgi:hypothetical protein